jgi:hypothetical protein
MLHPQQKQLQRGNSARQCGAQQRVAIVAARVRLPLARRARLAPLAAGPPASSGAPKVVCLGEALFGASFCWLPMLFCVMRDRIWLL